MSNRAARCPYCGGAAPTVFVHGHGQCAHCGNNVEPCCAGASAQDEAAATPAIDAVANRALLARLFEHLGGTTATVTREALLFALTQALGSDLDEATLVLQAAQRVGVVEAADGRAGAYRLRS